MMKKKTAAPKIRKPVVLRQKGKETSDDDDNNEDDSNDTSNSDSGINEKEMMVGEKAEKYVYIGLEKQKRFLEEIVRKKPHWGADMKKRTIRFATDDSIMDDGDKDNVVIRENIEVIGTFSEYTSTFLWAFLNRGANFPSEAVELSKTIADLIFSSASSPENGVSKTGTFPATRNFVLLVGLVAVGMNRDSAGYYMATYPGGAAMLLVPDLPLAERVDPAIDYMYGYNITSNFEKLIYTYPISDHRACFLSYLELKGLSSFVTSDDNSITCNGTIETKKKDNAADDDESNDKPVKIDFIATFDPLNRLTQTKNKI